ncbi:MAG: pimeloyl-ACP methyl ester carboxylesterase [Bacteroidia bacterium]
MTYQCHAVDLPGFGENEQHAETIEDVAHFVFQFMDNNKIDKACVIGHSMGGYVALEMLHFNPLRIDAIGLVHSHAAVDAESKMENRRKLIAFIDKNGSEQFLKEFAKQLISPKQKEHGLRGQAFELVKLTSSESVISATKAMLIRKDHLATLSTNKPTLWIIGRNDTFMPYNEVLRQAQLSPNSVILTLKDVGHLCMYEAPQKTLEIVKDFLHKVETSTQ